MPADLKDYFKKDRRDDRDDYDDDGGDMDFFNNFGKKAGLLYILIFLVAILIIVKPFVVIQSGEVGIKVTAGKYEPTPLGPGFHVYIPFIQDIIIVDTKVRVINYTSGEDGAITPSMRNGGIKYKPAISVLDARGLPVSIDLTVQYRLKPQSAPQTIARWGLAWEDKIINPVVRDIVRNVIGKYPAEELPIKRNEIAKRIEVEIKNKLDSFEGSPVELISVQLRNIILPPKIKEQIERVQIAKQEAERTRYEVERAKQEAQKKAALATGVAEARKIEAKGKADAIKIEADAHAYANQIIAKSLTPYLLRLREIETQGKFNEALKVNKDAKIFLTPGGAVPNIWIDTKDKKISSSVEGSNK